MKGFQKVLCCLLLVAAFLLVTMLFVNVLSQSLAQEETARSQTWISAEYSLYTVSETEAETVSEETEPEETLPEETEPEVSRIQYDTVPRFFQTDYPDIRFGSGTMATSGSPVTCLAMVASYLTGYEYLPDDMAYYFGDFIGSSIALIEEASDTLQLPWERAANIDVTLQALREGKIAIVLMNERSVFMDSQHFVVFTGITEDNRILVNDPYRPNYDSWNLQNALENGFKRTDLSGGYSGAWIYDPSEVPEEPFRYWEEGPGEQPRYPDLVLTQQDKELIARLVWGEAQGEPFEGQQAVAEVILNRLAADNFPNTVQDIVYAEGQFLSAPNLYLAELTHTQYEAVERAIRGPYVLPEDVVFFSQYAVNDNVWGTIGSHVFCRQW